MKAIADASSLIVLSRIDALWLLKRLFGAMALIPGVEAETVVQGKARGYRDALRIEDAIRDKDLVVITLTDAEKHMAVSIRRSAPALSATDCQTIACAKERRIVLVMEEQRGRNIALAHGVEYMILQVLPLHGLIGGQVSFEECDDMLLRIGRAMHTDEAVITVLRAAAGEIRRLRAQ
ncbi:MAG: hypothetical protein AB1714_10870 [Acidobacteriota bacterium]